MAISALNSYATEPTYQNTRQAVDSDETTAFDAMLNVKGTESSPKQEGSVGIIFRQMIMSGQQENSIVHNGVPMFFSVEQSSNGSYKFSTTIGVENANTKWGSVMTKDGVVTFDLNDPGSVMKCIGMFSSEDANKIMQKLQTQKIANAIEHEIDSRLNAITEHMQNELQDNTTTAEDVENQSINNENTDVIPSPEQLNLLFVDHNDSSIAVVGGSESK